MMKKILSLTYLALAIGLLLSCEREILPQEPIPDGEGIVLFVRTNSPTTRAADYDDNEIEPYNEMLIKTIDWYIYPEGGTNANAVLHGRWSAGSGERINKEQTVSITVSETDINYNIFPQTTGANTCEVYTIVNYPSAHPSAATDIPSLKALALTADFQANATQSSFVMDGQLELHLSSRTLSLAAYGTVNVQRVASKTSISLVIADTVKIPVYATDIDGNYIYEEDEHGDPVLDENGNPVRRIAYYEEWTPIRTGLKTYLVNAIDNAKINAEPSDVTPHYFTYAARTPNRTRTVNGKTWYDFAPYYSYPQSWTYGVKDAPYIKVELPWSNGARQKQFYYRVMLPGNHMTRNSWCHMNVDIAMLGSETDNVQVTIDNGSYYVVDWNELVITKENQILDIRYLSVPQTEYTMYNQSTLTISYTSSDDCDVVLNSATYRDFYNRDAQGNPTDHNVLSETNSGGWVTAGPNRTVIINHELNNDITSSAMNTAPYTFVFTIKHQGDAGNTYYEQVTVKQYPAIYITDEHSNGYVFVKNNSNTNAVNTIYDDSGTQNATTRIGSLVARSSITGSGTNNNQYQYNIHLTVLNDANSQIADPRGPASTPSGLNNITNYRPAAENTQDCIAPVIKVASSYGKTSSTRYEKAVLRCAAYQENGYPAGRWRLPTKAEINFLVNLSQIGKIPSLFDPTATDLYWAAGKLGYGSSGFIDLNDATANNNATTYTKNNTTYEVWTRCVYDVWYWGNGQHQMTTWSGYKTDYDNNYDILDDE